MPPLRIAVLPCAGLGAVLCVLHLGAGALGALMSVPVWSKTALVAAIAWSLVKCLEMYSLLRAPGAIVGLNVTREGDVVALTREGGSLECELMPSSFVSYRVTILNLRPNGARRERHVVLCCGNVNGDEFRRLRVRLRWAAGASMNQKA